MKAIRVNQRRRCSWLRMLCTPCGFDASPEQSSGWISQNTGSPGSEQQRSTKYNPRSRPTIKASISLPDEDSLEILLPSRKEERSVVSPISFYSSMSSSSPNTTRMYFNQHCSQKQDVHSPTSRSSPSRSPLSDSSSDMTSPTSRASPKVYSSSPDMTSPTSRASPVDNSSPHMRRKFLNQHCHEQENAHSPTSHSSHLGSNSLDLTRMYFNQHCYQALHSASSKKSRIPRKHSKSGSGKSSRRKRSGMRSPSHRTYNSKSPGRALKGRTEDNEDKSSAMRAHSHTTSDSKSLGTILTGSNEESEDKQAAICSPSYRTSHSTSSGRNAHGRTREGENKGPRYTSFDDVQGEVGRVISSPITRRQALALIGRQKLLANRKYPGGSIEYCRRQWRPALQSISEAASWESF